MKKIRWVCSYHGFGFGVWHSTYPPIPTAIWTICIGPLSVYLSRN